MLDTYPDVLKRKEVLEILRVAEATLKRIRKLDPSFPHNLNPNAKGALMLSKDDVVAWLTRHSRKPNR